MSEELFCQKEKGHPMGLDQVVLVGQNDLHSLKLHILATFTNNDFVDHTYYIHPTLAQCLETIEHLKQALPTEVQDTITFIDENELLSPDVCANKWIYQQMLKLSVDCLRGSHGLSEPFLFTDVDTLCLRKTSIEDCQHDGKFIFFVASGNSQSLLADNFEHATSENKHDDPAFVDWFWSMNWTVCQLLGLTPDQVPFLGAIDAWVIWSQKHLRAMKRSIEARFNRPWHQAILAQFASFILNYPNNFFYDPDGIRPLAFTLNEDLVKERAKPGFDELYHRLRLGFSEWQLYTYYLSTLSQSNYKIGLLGASRHPLVAEYNYRNNTPQELTDILSKSLEEETNYTNFVYFYPGIGIGDVDEIEQSLLKKLSG